MNHSMFSVRRLLALTTLTLAATLGTASAQTASAPAAPPAGMMALDPAADGSRWLLQTSVYTKHFHPDERHDNSQNLVDIEYWRRDGWLGGIAWFQNSFSQPTQYAFVGYRWRFFESQPNVYVKLTAGLIHGYKGEFRDKIPFNRAGIAPAILPSIGWSNNRFASELVLFGTSGLMFTAGVFLP